MGAVMKALASVAVSEGRRELAGVMRSMTLLSRELAIGVVSSNSTLLVVMAAGYVTRRVYRWWSSTIYIAAHVDQPPQTDMLSSTATVVR